MRDNVLPNRSYGGPQKPVGRSVRIRPVSPVQLALCCGSLILGIFSFAADTYTSLRVLADALFLTNLLLCVLCIRELLDTRALGKTVLAGSCLVFFWLDAALLAHGPNSFAVPVDLPGLMGSFDRRDLQQGPRACRRAAGRKTPSGRRHHVIASTPTTEPEVAADRLRQLAGRVWRPCCSAHLSLVRGRVLSRHEGITAAVVARCSSTTVESCRRRRAPLAPKAPLRSGSPWAWRRWSATATGNGSSASPRRLVAAGGPRRAGDRMAASWFGHTIGLLSGLAMATLSEIHPRYAAGRGRDFLCRTRDGGDRAAVCAARVLRRTAARMNRIAFRRATRACCGSLSRLGATNAGQGCSFASQSWPWCRSPATSPWDSRLQAAAAPLSVVLGLAGVSRRRRGLAPGRDVAFITTRRGSGSTIEFGRVSGNYTAINQPALYYLFHFARGNRPWIAVVPCGLWLTWRRHSDSRSPERFLWCWALADTAGAVDSLGQAPPLLAAHLAGARGRSSGPGTRMDSR